MESKYHFKENGYIVNIWQHIDTFYYTQILGKEEGLILHSREVDFSKKKYKIIKDIFREPKVPLPNDFNEVKKLEKILKKILDEVK